MISFLCITNRKQLLSRWNLLLLLDVVNMSYINPFHSTDLFWYPPETSENFWFSDVFRGYQKRSVARNELTRRTRKLDFYYWFILCHRSPFILSVFEYSVVINIETVAEGSTYFMSLVSFYTPLETLETRGFLMFSGAIERPVTWFKPGCINDPVYFLVFHYNVNRCIKGRHVTEWVELFIIKSNNTCPRWKKWKHQFAVR